MSYHIEMKETEVNGKIVKKYRGVVELPKSSDGRRHRKKTKSFARRKDAVKAAENLENLYLKGISNPDYENLMFSDLCKKFLEDTSTNNKKLTTIENYRKVIKNHLLPRFKDFRVKALNYELVQNYIEDLNVRGYKYNTIDNIKGVFSVVMKYALDKIRCIDYNPVNNVEIPKSSKLNKGLSTQRKNDYIEQENINRIFERFPEGNPNFISLILGYKCGCRDAEAYAVTWDDIDFEEGTLYINKQLQYLIEVDKNGVEKRYWSLVPPKYDSFRLISLDTETVDILKREKKRQQADREKDGNYITILYDGKRINYDEGEPVDFVIKLDHGDFKSPNTRQHIAQVIHKELGMPFTYHSLRHTHATILAEGGHDPFYIKERLGHKSLEITLKYYLHSTKGTRKAAKPKLEEIMKAFSINNTAQENS